MKPIYLRSFLIVFSVLTSVICSMGQTTVTLPTIACSTCNGPGSFATTAPACTPALVGAPLTISWGAATGATSYTIMIATDAAMTQNVAAHTLTGTTLSVPEIALMPSTTYYWTVFANSATGSTKATGGVCSFITNTTWKGTATTSGFPKGTTAQQLLNNGITGGYMDCRTGDGTCASGDNLACNPTFQLISSGTPFVPNWHAANNFNGSGRYFTSQGVSLAGAGAGIPPSGTTTGFDFEIGVGGSAFALYQQLYENNPSSAPANYELSFYAKLRSTATVTTGGSGAAYFTGLEGTNNIASTALSTTWTKYTNTVSIPAGAASRYLEIGFYTAATVATDAYFTDVRLCKL